MHILYDVSTGDGAWFWMTSLTVAGISRSWFLILAFPPWVLMWFFRNHGSLKRRPHRPQQYVKESLCFRMCISSSVASVTAWPHTTQQSSSFFSTAGQVLERALSLGVKNSASTRNTAGAWNVVGCWERRCGPRSSWCRKVSSQNMQSRDRLLSASVPSFSTTLAWGVMLDPVPGMLALLWLRMSWPSPSGLSTYGINGWVGMSAGIY